MITHCALPTSALRSPSIAGRATLRAVKSLAITKTPSPIATRAIMVPGWIWSSLTSVAVPPATEFTLVTGPAHGQVPTYLV